MIVTSPQAEIEPSLRDLLDASNELDHAEPAYADAKHYAENDAPEFFASQRIRRRLANQQGKFRVNLCRKAISAVTDKLAIGSVSVPGTPGEDGKDTANEAATRRLVRDVYDANELPLEAPVIMRRACTYGDEYVFLARNDEGGVDIERSGAMTTRVLYDPERPRRPRLAIKRWSIGREGAANRRIRVNLYYPPDDEDGGRIERWISVAGTKGTDAEHWQRYSESDAETGEETLPDVEELDRWPVYHFRTDRPYGRPLHVEAYGAQDAVNKLLVTMMSTVDHQGWPTRYALAESGTAEGDDDLDDFGALDDPDQTGITDEARKEEESGRLRDGPAQLWWLKNAKGAGQFAAANPDVFLKPADWYVRMSAQATDTPLHMYDPGGDQPSGDSRRAALDSLTSKVEWLQLSFGSTWEALLSDALALLGVNVEKVLVSWKPVDAVDDLEGWQTVQAKIEAGVPVAQALMEAGYERPQVEEWLAGSDEQDLKRRVALLAQIAAISRDLGNGVATGILPAELVEQILAGFLGHPVDIPEQTVTRQPPELATTPETPDPNAAANPAGGVSGGGVSGGGVSGGGVSGGGPAGSSPAG